MRVCDVSNNKRLSVISGTFPHNVTTEKANFTLANSVHDTGGPLTSSHVMGPWLDKAAVTWRATVSSRTKHTHTNLHTAPKTFSI